MKLNILLAFILLSGYLIAAQQESLSPELKDAVLHDSACTKSPDAADIASTLTETPIRSGGKDVGEIVEVQGACHCQGTNCDNLVYLHSAQGYKLALHEKYASLHPMKIVKLGMPSLTGQYEVGPEKIETTVYDWNGKDYKPSLCATVIKDKKPPKIEHHACKVEP
jgi:hypothetical protein